jgi:hypothetical protein
MSGGRVIMYVVASLQFNAMQSSTRVRSRVRAEYTCTCGQGTIFRRSEYYHGTRVRAWVAADRMLAHTFCGLVLQTMPWYCNIAILQYLVLGYTCTYTCTRYVHVYCNTIAWRSSTRVPTTRAGLIIARCCERWSVDDRRPVGVSAESNHAPWRTAWRRSRAQIVFGASSTSSRICCAQSCAVNNRRRYVSLVASAVAAFLSMSAGCASSSSFLRCWTGSTCRLLKGLDRPSTRRSKLNSSSPNLLRLNMSSVDSSGATGCGQWCSV